MFKRKFSKATSGSGGCPRCGSMSWKAKRSLAGKVAMGVLAPKTRVRCNGCGKEYQRG